MPWTGFVKSVNIMNNETEMPKYVGQKQVIMNSEIEMPKYIGQKQIWAFKIKEILRDGEGENRESDGSAMITPEEKGYAPFRVEHEYMNKHKPEVGGYFVQYEDGYKSFSPAKPFKKAYRSIDEMTFGLAIEALRNGKLLARKGWNRKDMFVCKQVPAEIYCNIIPKMSSLPEKAKEVLFDRDNSIFYENQMIIIKPDNKIDSWVPSSSDIFAEDWFIVE